MLTFLVDISKNVNFILVKYFKQSRFVGRFALTEMKIYN